MKRLRPSYLRHLATADPRTVHCGDLLLAVKLTGWLVRLLYGPQPDPREWSRRPLLWEDGELKRRND